MGKLMDHLQRQLKTERKQEAEDCLKLYQYLKETTGSVWSSQWQVLTVVTFKGFPSDVRWYKPSSIGYQVLKSLSDNNSTKI